MQELKLTQPVTVIGDNLFGQPSRVTFSPIPARTPRRFHDSWLWRPNGEAQHLIPIDPSVVEYRRRRLRLANTHSYLEVIEHIAPLRWLGIDGLVLEGHGWPPYHGRPYEYYTALLPHLKPTGHRVHWYTLQKEIYLSHKGPSGGYSHFIPQDPTLPLGLNLSITVMYPEIGKVTIQRSLPSQRQLLLKDFQAHTQGLPHWAYYLSVLGQYVLLWKHHRHITWFKQEPYSEEHLKDTRAVFASHRVIDLLGALALLHPTRLLAGTVVSVFGGHCADLAFINKMLPHAPPP